MSKLAKLAAKIIASMAVIAILAVTGVRANTASAALHHCAAYPGPGHCVTVGDCMPECEQAVIVECVSEGCCMCIF